MTLRCLENVPDSRGRFFIGFMSGNNHHFMLRFLELALGCQVKLTCALNLHDLHDSVFDTSHVAKNRAP